LHIKEHLKTFVAKAYDQTAYISYYQGRTIVDLPFIKLRRQARWDKLDPKMNWKPYWGINSDAYMIHFHGPKPFMRQAINKGTASQSLLKLSSDTYYHYCDSWQKIIESIDNMNVYS
jgi:hypothetical protein